MGEAQNCRQAGRELRREPERASQQAAGRVPTAEPPEQSVLQQGARQVRGAERAWHPLAGPVLAEARQEAARLA